ncbi:MAG: hypothetical protein ABSF44_10060 [Candidatus Bathyarchaeia archaeon]
MTKREYLSNIYVKFSEWSKGDWGYPFIAGFMALLFAAAVLLAVGSAWASNAADLAYFALAAGVILQLACKSKNKGKKTELL